MRRIGLTERKEINKEVRKEAVDEERLEESIAESGKMRRIGLTERKEINKEVRKEAVVNERIEEKKRYIIIGMVGILIFFSFLFYFFIVSPIFVTQNNFGKLAFVSVNFILNIAVSTIIIYLVTKYLFGETEEIGTSTIVAIVGSIIYSIAHIFLGTGLLAAIVGGIAWLIALKNFYNIRWDKAFLISIMLWIAVSLLSFLPTVIGPF